MLGAPATIDEGSSGTLTLSANDIDGDTLTYTWATDGGTLVPSAGGTSATLAGGDGPATRHVTVKVSDGTTWVTVAKDVAVNNLAPSVTIVQPSPGTHTTVGTAVALSAATSDAGGDAVTCSISWGDATTAASGCAANARVLADRNVYRDRDRRRRRRRCHDRLRHGGGRSRTGHRLALRRLLRSRSTTCRWSTP